MPKNYEVFISYRRKGGYDTAKLLYDRLRMDGYSVSFDIDTLEKGNFDNELENRVTNCKDFVLVLSSGIFDRFFDSDTDPEDDWVRREISCAIKTNKNIVPLALEGFSFPKTSLPSDVKDIARKNTIDLSPQHFESAYARMKQVFLISKPHWKTRHKKAIISLAATVFLALTAYLFFTISTISSQKDLELKMQYLADSIEAAKDMEIAHVADSIKRALASNARKAQAKAAKEETSETVQKSPEKNQQKTLHWGGPNNDVGQVIFEKIAPAGVSKMECEGNGFILKANNPSCKEIAEGHFACSYSPKLTITDCNGKIISFIGTSLDFAAESQTSEANAREELVKELSSVNFSAWVSDIKGL